jgi:hypothetical protein
LNGSKLPFGLAEIRPGYSPEQSVEHSKEQEIFFPKTATLLRTCKFERPAVANHAFDYWQRQRKIWWRKVNYVKLDIGYDYNFILSFINNIYLISKSNIVSVEYIML